MGRTIDLGAFEWGMVIDARRTGLSVSRTATLLGFLHSTVSHVYREWSTTKRTSSQLGTNVGSIGINIGQYPCGTLSISCGVHALTN
jgi:hypothetical protein